MTYLIQMNYGNASNINNDLIFVIIPVLSITVLMFGLRALFLDATKTKLLKQK